MTLSLKEGINVPPRSMAVPRLKNTLQAIEGSIDTFFLGVTFVFVTVPEKCAFSYSPSVHLSYEHREILHTHYSNCDLPRFFLGGFCRTASAQRFEDFTEATCRTGHMALVDKHVIVHTVRAPLHLSKNIILLPHIEIIISPPDESTARTRFIDYQFEYTVLNS